MRWLLWYFCLLAESYETINHYHYYHYHYSSRSESENRNCQESESDDGTSDSAALVSWLGLSLETHVCESQSRRFLVSRLWILRRDNLLKLCIIQIFFCLLYLQVRNNQNASEKCQNFEKTSCQKHGCQQKLFQRGANLIFCLSFPCWWRCNANARSQNAFPFLHHNKNAPCYAGA